MKERTVLHYEHKRTSKHLLFLGFTMATNIASSFILRTSIEVGLIN